MGWVYRNATWDSGPGSKADNLTWQKHGVFVFQSGLTDDQAWMSIHADHWYRAHFTISEGAVVFQHYFPENKLVTTPHTDGENFIYIGVSGPDRNASLTADQYEALMQLVRWMFGGVVRSGFIVKDGNLRGSLLR